MMLSLHGFAKHGGSHIYLFGPNTKKKNENRIQPHYKRYRGKFITKHENLETYHKKRVDGKPQKSIEFKHEIDSIKLKIKEIEYEFLLQNNS